MPKKPPKRVGKWNPFLEALLFPIDKLHLDPDNARLHDERNISAIAGSLAEFGQQKPIVVLSDGTIIAGNGTYAAVLNMGWTHLAVVEFDSEERERAIAYAISDNRTAELAEWDLQILSDNIKELHGGDIDLGNLGWEDYELDPLLASDWTPPPLKDLPPGGSAPVSDLVSVEFTPEQWVTVEAAILAERKDRDDMTLSYAEGLVAVCQQFVDNDG